MAENEETPQPADTENAEAPALNRAQRRHGGKAAGTSGTPVAPKFGGDHIQGPHGSLPTQHKRGTIPRKKGM